MNNYNNRNTVDDVDLVSTVMIVPMNKMILVTTTTDSGDLTAKKAISNLIMAEGDSRPKRTNEANHTTERATNGPDELRGSILVTKKTK